MVINMRNASRIFLSLLMLASFVCTGCGENSSNSLVLPGKDRIWWYEGFDSREEVEKFILTLRKAGKNGKFRFGFSDIAAPNGYKHFYTSFSGHIDIDASNKEDIYYSEYDYFRIETYFNEDTEILPIYNSFEIYFYPFYSDEEDIKNSEIQFEITDYFGGLCEISFSYDNSTVMEVRLSSASNGKIDREQVVNALIDNYELIV